MNCVKEVAELLGVELYEKFQIDKCGEELYRFSSLGLETYCSDQWYWSPLLENLVSGEFNIVKLGWEKQSILTDKEKDYLKFVINPFKDDVKYIMKWPVGNDKEFISIGFYNEESMAFPSFMRGSKYQGMKIKYDYTLGELGL